MTFEEVEVGRVFKREFVWLMAFTWFAVISPLLVSGGLVSLYRGLTVLGESLLFLSSSFKLFLISTKCPTPGHFEAE